MIIILEFVLLGFLTLGSKKIKFDLLLPNKNPFSSSKDWKTNGIFSNLKENTTYYVQVMVTDKAGNTTTKIEEVTTMSSKLVITSEEYNVLDEEKIMLITVTLKKLLFGVH